MKQLIFLVSIIITSQVNAQNVGVGTTTPSYPLTVVPDDNGNGIVYTGFVETGFNTQPTWGGILKTLGSYNLNFAANNNVYPTLIIATDRNVGIGLNSSMPAYKLDLGGRMRLQQNASNGQTAGIWF